MTKPKQSQAPKATAAQKDAFHDEVTALIERKLPRPERILAISALIDAYVDGTGERPDGSELERLTDAILAEELTDRHPDKVTRNEYPFMSDWQLDLRRDREYSIDLAENHGIDGRDYREPTRRHRTAKEDRFVEKVAQAKNRRRKAQYRRDTASGPLVSYDVQDAGGELTPDFVSCVGIGELWRDRLSLVN